MGDPPGHLATTRLPRRARRRSEYQRTHEVHIRKKSRRGERGTRPSPRQPAAHAHKRTRRNMRSASRPTQRGSCEEDPATEEAATRAGTRTQARASERSHSGRACNVHATGPRSAARQQPPRAPAGPSHHTARITMVRHAWGEGRPARVAPRPATRGCGAKGRGGLKTATHAGGLRKGGHRRSSRRGRSRNSGASTSDHRREGSNVRRQ